jgi:hypothetical protein
VPSPVDVTVSIVNHENRDRVIECLRSLADDGERRATVEVIVVDNASEDGSGEAIAGAFPSVGLIRRRRRHGFGANHNLALRRAAGRHVLLLNDDTLVEPGAIDALADYLDRHPTVALAAPMVLTGAGQRQESAWRLPSPLLDVVGALTLGHSPAPLSRGSSPRQVGWAIGCALLARRERIVAVGGFDEGYFMYSEEIDLARRLASAGLQTHWVPAATVIHQGQASTGGHASPARAVEMARSRRRYWRRHYSRSGRLIAQASVGLEFVVLALAAAVRGKPAAAFWLQARGCWRDPSRPGLREQASDWNSGADSAGAPDGEHLPLPHQELG